MLEFAPIKIKKWKMCNYCGRTIFSKEQAYRFNSMPYYICKGCMEKGGEQGEKNMGVKRVEWGI